MKTVSKILMLLLLVGSFALSATLKTIGIYAPNENITVHIKNQAADHKNWIGIYPRGSSNAWANVIKWDWTHGKNSVNIKGLPDGDYEARLFYNNSFKLEAKTYIIVDKYANSTISTQKTVYDVNENITIFTGGFSPERKAWVGIYPAGSSNDWDNVLDWSWSESKFVSNTIVLDGLPKGKYEARLFLNNSFILEGKTEFSVGDEVEAIGKVQNAGVNQVVTVTVNKHSSDDDWVGIFKKGVEKKWGNQIAWSFVKGKNRVTINPGNKLPAGEYEVALFLDNSLDKVEASVGFVVKDGGNNHQYGAPGPYMNEIKEIHNNNDKYVAYYPEHNVQNAPIILMLGYYYAEGTYINGTKITLRNEGIMKYLASLGCYVIGNKSTHDEWQDGDKWEKIPYDKAIIEAINKGADKTKFALMGHSAGGMATYRMMKKYKSEHKGYGTTKNFIIDLHGYHAAGMTRTDLQSLNDTDTLMLMYGGLNGNANQSKSRGTTSGLSDFSEDPRTLLTLTNLMPDNTNKSFMVVNTRDHFYSWGEWEAADIGNYKYEAIKDKSELLKPIDAMVKYEFFNNNGQYNDARAILFDGYEQTIQNVYNATKEFLDGGGLYEYGCVSPEGNPLEDTIDYCNDHGLQ